MSEPAVLLEYRERVALVTLNRPQAYNAFNGALRSGLLAVLHELEARKDIRVVILTAQGKGFSAGADLKEGLPPNVSAQIHSEYEPLMLGLRRLDKVVLAAVNGATAGIGCALVASSDLALMAEDAYMQMAFSKIALVPDGGLTWDLVRALGYKRAYRLMIEAGKLSPAQCLEYGLINEVVPGAELQQRAWAWAQQLCELSPVANALTKRALHRAMELTLPGAIAVEATLQDTAAARADCKEGVTAFLEKRPANYPGF